MRKLDLKNYTISLPDRNGVLRLIPYQFKNTLTGLLLHPSLGLNGDSLLRANEVVEKIEGKNESDNNTGFFEVLLTEEDYQLIVDTCKKFRGFSNNDVKLVKRIYNCPQVDVKIKKGV